MTVTLTANGYIKNTCDTFTVVWSQISGPVVVIPDPTLLQIFINISLAGTYVFRVTGTDSNGSTATDDVTITAVSS